MSFDEIALSREEYRNLKKSIKSEISVSKFPRLLALSLVEERYNSSPGTMPVPTGYARISDVGLSYLMYVKRLKQDKNADRLHDWLIAIFSALAGALLSRPIWDWIDQLTNSLADFLKTF